MKAEIVTVWLIGTTDGYSHMYSNVAYLHETDAERALTPSGGYGVKTSTLAIKVGDEYYQVVSRTPLDVNGEKTKRVEKLKESALSKLSEEEKEVLGLRIE